MAIDKELFYASHGLKYPVIEESCKENTSEKICGKWERRYSRPGVYADLNWYCSACNNFTHYKDANYFDYCPYCGIKMKREDSDVQT